MLDVPSEELLDSVFQTLAYADVFEYPLTVGETFRYLTSTKASFEQVTQALAEASIFTSTGDYFTLRGREHLVAIRKRRAEIAARLWPKAARYGRLISSLPFVRMVAVTGSLAVDNTDEDKDIDFMIVAAPGRLWTVRALVLLVARFANLERIHLCPNYLVTTNALELKERSLYVAHELAQMIPLSGMQVYDEMRQRNDWIREYLPNASGAPALPPSAAQASTIFAVQKTLEILFGFPAFAWFERWEMDRKISRLRREQSSSVESYFSRDVCKGHVDKHGKSVEAALAVRLQKMAELASTETT